MTNEWAEFRAYTEQPTYTATRKTDTSYLGRFTFDMISDFTGFGRILTIVARGYLFHDKDGSLFKGEPYDRIEYARKALRIEEKLYAVDDSDVLTTNLSIGYEKLVDLYYELGDIKTSCEYLRKDYELCKKLHEKLCTAETLNNLIGCYQRLARNALDSENFDDVRQDADKACVSLKGLLRNSDSLSAKIIVADVFNRFGKYYSKFDRPEKAKENYLAAIYICQVIGDEDTSGKAEAKMVTALNGINMINEASE